MSAARELYDQIVKISVFFGRSASAEMINFAIRVVDEHEELLNTCSEIRVHSYKRGFEEGSKAAQAKERLDGYWQCVKSINQFVSRIEAP